MKKLTSLLVMFLALVFTLNVKADELYTYYTIEKGNGYGELYDHMPTEVKQGDIITVKGVAKKIGAWLLDAGSSTIYWDKNAFELVEVNGDYVQSINDNIKIMENYFSGDNKYYVYYEWNGGVSATGNEELIEFKFRVLKDTKDGVYEIYQENEDGYLGVIDNNDTSAEYVDNAYTVLRYQVGEPKLTFDYAPEDIGTNVYIIGDYMFTRTPADLTKYGGVLTTKYIMLASKSIQSREKDDMIIYLKNSSGEWKEAIDNVKITPPDKFEISYIDMVATYRQNGYYSDSNNENIIGIVQLNENDVVVLVANEKMSAHGIGTINNNVITVNFKNKVFNITLGDGEISVNTNESNFTARTLQKKANYSLNDYYCDYYYNDYDVGLINDVYLKSEYTGKYTYGNYEVYFIRTNSSEARVYIRENGSDDVILRSIAWRDYDNPTEWWIYDNDTYTIVFGENGFTIISDDNDAYNGSYQKVAELTMEEVIKLREINSLAYWVNYYVDDELYDSMLIENGEKAYNCGYYDSERLFVEWQLNGHAYDFDTPVNGPMRLDALMQPLGVETPILSIIPGDGHDYVSHENNQYAYNLTVDFDKYCGETNNTCSIIGFCVYNGDSNEYFESYWGGFGSYVTVYVPEYTSKTYYAKVVAEINGKEYYSGNSNFITLSPNSHTVTFDSDGGSDIDSQTVNYNAQAARPDDPVKTGFTFAGWKLNDELFDFDTAITEDITLVAVWEVEKAYSMLARTADTTKVIDFGKKSSSENGKGLYRLKGTEDDTYPIYYYRGEVENNNVIFGGFCWQMVRTTETGGIKMVYNGAATGDGKTCENDNNNRVMIEEAFNPSYKSPMYVGYMYNDVYLYSTDDWTENALFGSNVEWNGTHYTLTDATLTAPNTTHHYSCNEVSADATCESVRYVFRANQSLKAYIVLTNGEKIEDALYKMSGNGTEEVIARNSEYKLNNTSSTAKIAIETWFRNNLTNEEDSNKINYQEYLEDTIWCNDRSYKIEGTSNTYDRSGWNPNGGDLLGDLYYGVANRFDNDNWYSVVNVPSFACPNLTDQFSVGNAKAKLDYPVGLLTADELILAGVGGNSRSGDAGEYFYLYIGNRKYNLSMTPYVQQTGPRILGSSEYGGMTHISADDGRAIRPAISLKFGIEFENTGDGTPTNPYVVKIG